MGGDGGVTGTRQPAAPESGIGHVLLRDKAERDAMFDRVGDDGVDAMNAHWPIWARPAQMAPEGDWRVWLLMAGRGFGKTRAGAEWVRAIAEKDGDARIALIGASPAGTRSSGSLPDRWRGASGWRWMAWSRRAGGAISGWA